MNRVRKQKKIVRLVDINYLIILLSITIFVIPLTVRAYVYDPRLSSFTWFPNITIELDLFLYWKSIILIVAATIMSLLLIKNLQKIEISNYRKEYWIYFLLGYGTLTMLSTIASPYSSYGFAGISKQFESVWVIVSYCIITLYSFYAIHTDNDLKIIHWSLYLLLVILCIIGLLQLTGNDFFESELGQSILIPEKLIQLIENLTFKFADSGTHQVYMTLYNPNYVGMFASLILPISIVQIYNSQANVQKIAWAIISVALLICTLGSGSKTFVLSAVVIVSFALMLYRKIVFRQWKWILCAITVVLISGTLYFSNKEIDLFQYIKSALFVESSEHPLENISVTDEAITITYRGEMLHIQYIESNKGVLFSFMDENDNYLDYTFSEEGKVYLTDERFQHYSFVITQGEGEHLYRIGVLLDGIPLIFGKTNNGYQYVNSFGKTDEIVPVESAIFTDYDHFATERGYIWSRTIPLLKKYWFLGSGADTFMLVFPQNDYIGKFNVNYSSTIVTKPHNLYLQIAVQHGGVALICFLLVCLLYIKQCFQLYWYADFTNPRHMMGTGILLGILGYLISGITTDSCVAVAPLFWVMLGIGFAVNRMNRVDKVA